MEAHTRVTGGRARPRKKRSPYARSRSPGAAQRSPAPAPGSAPHPPTWSRPHPPVDLRLLGPAAQRVRLAPQLAAHLPAGRRHAGVLILDQVQHQPDRPVTQLVRILPCCSHRPTLPWIGSLHKTRGDSTAGARTTTTSPRLKLSPPP